MHKLKRLSLCFIFIFSITSQAAIQIPGSAVLIHNKTFHGLDITQSNAGAYWTGNFDDISTWGLPLSSYTNAGFTNQFNYIAANTVTPLSDYIEHEIDNEPLWGSLTPPVMKMKVNAYDDASGKLNRIQYNWWPTSDVKEVFIQYYMKFPQAVSTATMKANSGILWWNIFELHEEYDVAGSPGPDYHRALLSLYRKYEGGEYKLGWRGEVQHFNSSPFYVVDEFNHTVAIPENQWFLMTIHFKLGDQGQGHYEAEIRKVLPQGGFDGPTQTLFAETGFSTNANGNIKLVNFLKAYGSKTLLGTLQSPGVADDGIEQYIYNSKIWVVTSP